jgi:type IV secretory pathway VirB2 component (pilin)
MHLTACVLWGASALVPLWAVEPLTRITPGPVSIAMAILAVLAGAGGTLTGAMAFLRWRQVKQGLSVSCCRCLVCFHELSATALCTECGTPDDPTKRDPLLRKLLAFLSLGTMRIWNFFLALAAIGITVAMIFAAMNMLAGRTGGDDWYQWLRQTVILVQGPAVLSFAASLSHAKALRQLMASLGRPAVGQ